MMADATRLRETGRMRSLFRSIRKASSPLRDWIRVRGGSPGVQRSVALRPEDAEPTRRRWHVLVDLIHEQLSGQNLTIVEVGTRTGETTEHLHTYCPQVSAFYCIDLQEPAPEANRINGLDRVHFIKGYSDEAASRFDDGSVDLVFIDEAHSETWVRRDVQAWLPKGKIGGVISGHAYGSKNHPGVKLAVDDLFSGHSAPVSVDANKVWWTLKE